MKKRRDVPTRHEVKERGDGYENDMEKKEHDLDTLASDVDTVRGTRDSLDLSGTSEGAEEVEGAMESAEDVTEQKFDTEDEKLEQIQQENEKFEGELQDRKEASESNIGKVSDATGVTKTSETLRELEGAKDAAHKDKDFLAEQFDRARIERERSNTAQEKLQSRVHGRRKV